AISLARFVPTPRRVELRLIFSYCRSSLSVQALGMEPPSSRAPCRPCRSGAAGARRRVAAARRRAGAGRLHLLEPLHDPGAVAPLVLEVAAQHLGDAARERGVRDRPLVLLVGVVLVALHRL